MTALEAEAAAFGVHGALQLPGLPAGVPFGRAGGDMGVDLDSQTRRINMHT